MQDLHVGQVVRLKGAEGTFTISEIDGDMVAFVGDEPGESYVDLKDVEPIN